MIRALILSDIRLYSDGLSEILNREPDFEVIRNLNNRENVISVVKEIKPDTVLLDVNLKDSLKITKAVTSLDSNINIIVLGISNNDESILKFAEVGVAGYVTTNDTIAELIRVVKHAVQGKFNCNPHVARMLLRHISSLASQNNQAGELNSLTKREHQIGQLLARGLSNKEIAREIHVEISTVKNHVHNILEKLHIRRRSQVAALFQKMI